MGLAARIDRLVPDISVVIARFPVTVLVSILLCGYVNLISVGSYSSDENDVIAGAAAAFIASGAAHLFAEGRRYSLVSSSALSLAAALLAGALGYFNMVLETSLIYLFAGLVPLLMISPYLRDNIKQGALWMFNLRLGLSLLLSFVVALVFAAGLSAIVESLNFLFNVGIGSNLHERIWSTSASLIGPIYGLSLMPRDLNEEVDIASQKNTLLERGVSVLVNYVLVPVILIYAVILHAYAIKIAGEQSLPKGQIGMIVSIYALGGTGAWLVAWPWREQGTRLLRWFMRGWFWLTIVPAILLAIAIWRRISDYGVTPDRYGILLVAIWVAALTGYLAYRRNRADMRAVLGGISALLLLGSVGPYGAMGLTVSSQVTRLAALFTANGILQNGKAVMTENKLSNDTINQGNSILYALRDAGGLDRIRPWFVGNAVDPFKAPADKWTIVGNIATYLGAESPVSEPAYLNFTSNVPLAIDVPDGSRLVGPLLLMTNMADPPQQPPLSAYSDGKVLRIRLETASYVVPVPEFIEKTRARLSPDSMKQPMVSFEIAPGVSVAIDSIYAQTKQLSSARFWVILPREKSVP